MEPGEIQIRGRQTGLASAYAAGVTKTGRFDALNRMDGTEVLTGRVSGAQTVRLKTPSVPSGFTQGEFGRDVARWGNGPEEAIARTSKLTQAEVNTMKNKVSLDKWRGSGETFTMPRLRVGVVMWQRSDSII